MTWVDHLLGWAAAASFVMGFFFATDKQIAIIWLLTAIFFVLCI